MKKIFVFLMVLLLAILPVVAVAEAPAADVVAETPEALTWDYLATVGGASVLVLIVVQLTKGLLDRFWKIPTTLYAYVLAVITMIAATAFTSGLTLPAALLTLFNGWIVAATAAKSYDVMAGK